jgi:hypothetical protein
VLVHDASGFTVVRSYQLGTDYWWTDDRFPCENQGILRLRSITELGKDGAPLQPWTFTYDHPTAPGSDWWLHHLLKTADNGQGGRVTYSYTNDAQILINSAPGTDLAECGHTSRFRVTEQRIEDGLGTTHKIKYTSGPDKALAWANWTPTPTTCLPNFEFGGYRQVQRQLTNGSDTVYQSVTTDYYQSQPAGCAWTGKSQPATGWRRRAIMAMKPPTRGTRSTAT